MNVKSKGGHSMKIKIPGTCPFCGKRTVTARVECKSCHTSFEGAFELPKLASLDEASQDFIEKFLVARGNMKEMQTELGLSYPTVRARLDEIVTKLGYPAEEEIGISKGEVLDMLENGDVTSEEAVELIRKARKS